MPKATKQIRNDNPVGDIWHPVLGYVDRGQVLEVDADLADELVKQIGNWSIVTPPSKES